MLFLFNKRTFYIGLDLTYLLQKKHQRNYWSQKKTSIRLPLYKNKKVNKRENHIGDFVVYPNVSINFCEPICLRKKTPYESATVIESVRIQSLFATAPTNIIGFEAF